MHVLPIGSGAFGAALLAKAHELGADMLVMGAYASTIRCASFCSAA